MPLKISKQKAILKAARKVLLAADSADVTMESIAREAGVAKGTLFLYYPSKDALLAAVHTDLTKAFVAELVSIMNHGSGGEQLLRCAVKALIEHLARKTVLMDALGERHRCGLHGSLAAKSHGGNLKLARAAKVPAILGALRSILEKCAADGLITLEDPLYAASALFGLCRGSLAYSRGPGRSLSSANKAQRVINIYLYGLRRKK